MKPLLTLASLTFACFLSSFTQANDWPQWLGPNRDGLTSESDLLQEWPEGGPKRVWLSDEIGLGYSGPAVIGDQLYIMGTKDNGEYLFALGTKNGGVIWSTKLGDIYNNNWGDGPRGTPTVDGDRIYTLAAKGALVCVDRNSGEELWRTEMVADLGGKIPNWGYAESPLVDGDLVVVTPGGSDGAIAAFDKQSGALRWRCNEVDNIAHYSSIVVARPHGKKQYVQLLDTRAVGVDPESGALLWEVPWPGQTAVIPTPIVRENQIYFTSGYGVGCMLVEIAEDSTAEVVYKNKTMKNHHGGVLLLGDHLFGHSDSVGWVCQEFATGDRIWRERSELGKGAIAYADGRLYCLSENEGEVVLAAPSVEGWQEHGRFTLDPQTEQRKPRGKIWMHPVIANGRLYLRDQELLFCFDVKQ